LDRVELVSLEIATLATGILFSSKTTPFTLAFCAKEIKDTPKKKIQMLNVKLFFKRLFF
jgi:hypothetical protein